MNFSLPKNTYFKTIWFIREYYDLRDRREDALFHSANPDGMPRGTDIGRPTENIAIKIADIDTQIRAIEESLVYIPAAYRKPILDNILNRAKPPKHPSAKTWAKWKRRYVYEVALAMHWIEE